LIETLVRLKFDSIMGRISFDISGEQQREFIMTQYQSTDIQDIPEVISPVAAKTRGEH